MSKHKAGQQKWKLQAGGPIRLGLIGLGNMGQAHARSILDGRVPGCTLTALSDTVPARGALFEGIPFFDEAAGLIQSGLVDAVLVATPHFSHKTIGVEVLKSGLHLLVEKPLSVHKADCERLIAAHQEDGQIFAAMFNQRTDPYYRKVRELVQGGELGAIRRVNWIITNWFRSEAYYASGGWRATWAGEGGGVLLNQCPHNLDLFQWIFGMPSTVNGFCQLGRYHAIEVEDDVTAYFEYPDGMTAVFITSTGESPGTNRLEVTGEQGRLVLENDTLLYTRNEIQTTEFSRTTASAFGVPPVWDVSIPSPPDHGEQHVGILKNFVAAIREGAELVAPGAEGLYSVELANAILYSSIKGERVGLPLSSSAYEKCLKKLIAASKPKKKQKAASKTTAEDFSKSF